MLKLARENDRMSKIFSNFVEDKKLADDGSKAQSLTSYL